MDGSVTLLLKWRELAVIFSIVAAAAVTVSFRRELARSWLLSDWAPNHATGAGLIVGFLTLVIGIVLAYWKMRQQFVYGLWEVVFGAYSAFQTALLLWPTIEAAKLLTIASAVYVVSRGAGNVSEAFTKEEKIERLKIRMTPGKVWERSGTSGGQEPEAPEAT